MSGTFRTLLVLAWCGLAVSCAGMSDEERIRELVAEAGAAAQEKRLDDLAALVADDYADRRGRNKRAALGTVGAYLSQAGPVFVFTRTNTVRVDGDRATAELAVAVAATPVSALKDLGRVRADLFRVELSLRRDGRSWLVTAAEWESAGLDAFLAD
jgi:hypothetical protein